MIPSIQSLTEYLADILGTDCFFLSAEVPHPEKEGICAFCPCKCAKAVFFASLSNKANSSSGSSFARCPAGFMFAASRVACSENGTVICGPFDCLHEITVRAGNVDEGTYPGVPIIGFTVLTVGAAGILRRDYSALAPEITYFNAEGVAGKGWLCGGHVDRSSELWNLLFAQGSYMSLNFSGDKIEYRIMKNLAPLISTNAEIFIDGKYICSADMTSETGSVIWHPEPLVFEVEKNTAKRAELTASHPGLVPPVKKFSYAAHLSKLLSDICTGISGMSARQSSERASEKELRELFTPSECAYTLSSEKSLKSCIAVKSLAAARLHFKELTDHICTGSNVYLIRLRVSELITLVSREVAAAGADPSSTLPFTALFSTEISKLTRPDEIAELGNSFMKLLTDLLTVNPERKFYSDAVDRCIRYIDKNYRDSLSLDELSRQVNFSKSYFCQLFRKETGTNIFTYINEVRVEKSKRMLLDSSVKLVDIAGACGFEDQSYYTKVFKRFTGISPKAYRSMNLRSAYSAD